MTRTDKVATCSSSRASLFVIAPGFISSSLSSRSVMLASLRRKAYRVKIKLQSDFRETFLGKVDYLLLLSFICRHFVWTLEDTPWTVVQLIALFLATLLNLSIWAVQSVAKQLCWVVLVCDLLYFWTVSCMRRSVFPFCSCCSDTRYLSFIRASQDSTSSSWRFDNSISWQVQNKLIITLKAALCNPAVQHNFIFVSNRRHLPLSRFLPAPKYTVGRSGLLRQHRGWKHKTTLLG